MADLKGLLQRAKSDSEEIDRTVKTIGKTKKAIEKLKKEGYSAIDAYVETFPDMTTSRIDANAKTITKLTTQLGDASLSLQKKVEDSKATLDQLRKSKEGGFSDATSRKMMLDYAEEYKISFLVVWAKVVIVIVATYLMWSTQNMLYTLATMVAVVIVWYTWSFIVHFFTGRNPSGGDKPRTCADGTAANATGSNCSTCPTVDNVPTNLYMSCEESVNGCCSNGMPNLHDDLEKCPAARACAASKYGCCPDGDTERTDINGNNCDWTYYEGNCSESKFGCCPNGLLKEDEKGTNCTPANACGFSAFGCCPDGSDRDDLAGSNCR